MLSRGRILTIICTERTTAKNEDIICCCRFVSEPFLWLALNGSCHLFEHCIVVFTWLVPSHNHQKVAGNRKGGRKIRPNRFLPPFLPPFFCTEQRGFSFSFHYYRPYKYKRWWENRKVTYIENLFLIFIYIHYAKTFLPPATFWDALKSALNAQCETVQWTAFVRNLKALKKVAGEWLLFYSQRKIN